MVIIHFCFQCTWMTINNISSSGGLSDLDDKKLEKCWSFYMTGKCTSINVCNYFSKKQINFEADPSMFLGLASRMKSLCSTSENLFGLSRENIPTLGFNSEVIHKWQFFKIGDRYGFFLTIDIFSSGCRRERKNYSKSLASTI